MQNRIKISDINNILYLILKYEDSTQQDFIPFNKTWQYTCNIL